MWLAIECSGDEASVAVGSPDGVVVEERIPGPRQHASLILPATERILSAAGTRLEDIESILISDGPGSFTGLRIGAALVKALVRAHPLPLRTASSLLIMAVAAGSGERRPVLALSDALRGELYYAAYRFGDQSVETLVAPSLGTLDEVRDAFPAGGLVVGAASQGVLLDLATRTGAPLLGPPAAAARAAGLIALGSWDNGLTVIKDPATWEPAYGRAAEAQVRWEEQHGRALPDSGGQFG